MYIRYEDSDKIREAVRIKHELGKSTREIASDLGISSPLVSYHKKKLGLLRDKKRNPKGLCLVCGKDLIEPGQTSVCRSKDCFSVMLEATYCQMPHDEADLYMITHILPRPIDVVFPESSVICTHQSVHRVFRDFVDHLQYHAYIDHLRKTRPTGPLWLDEEELRAHKLYLKEADYSRRNLYSEAPQPRRPRDRNSEKRRPHF